MPSSARPLLRMVPWLIAALIIVALFRKVPLDATLSALQHADLGRLGLTVLLGALSWFLLDALAYPLLFFPRSPVDPPLSAAEARSIRGMTYLLAPIHWNVGQAAVAFRLKTLRQLPLVEGGGALLLYQLISFFALTTLAAIGLLLAPHVSENDALAEIATRISPAFPIGLAAVILGIGLAIRSPWPNNDALSRLRNRPFLRAFMRIPSAHLLALTFLKILYHAVFAIVFFFGLRAFGVEPPFALALLATPLIQIAGGLPITPAGLGTQQAAMIYLFAGQFGDPDSEAAVAAFSFSFPLLLMLMRGCIGLFYLSDLRRGNEDQDRSRPGADPARRSISTVDTRSV